MHMLHCYALQEQEATGEVAIDFLVDMAKQVRTSPPNLVVPIAIQVYAGVDALYRNLLATSSP